jgi:hypothetical protein
MKYVIVVDDSTKAGKGLLDIAKSLAKIYKSVSVSLHDTDKPNALTRKAIQDARKGKTEKVSNIKSFIGSI